MRILPQDRLDAQRLDPSRLPAGQGFRLDLLDQLPDPLTVLLRCQVRPAGELRQDQLLLFSVLEPAEVLLPALDGQRRDQLPKCTSCGIECPPDPEFWNNLSQRGDMDCRQVSFSGHAIRRMFERSITRAEVLAALTTGEPIEAYPDDVPFPSVLLLTRVQQRVLHLVVAQDPKSGDCYLVTVYPPDPALWEPDFRTRRSS